MRFDSSGRPVVPDSLLNGEPQRRTSAPPEPARPVSAESGDMHTVEGYFFRFHLAPSKIMRQMQRFEWAPMRPHRWPFSPETEDNNSYMLECRQCGTRPLFSRDKNTDYMARAGNVQNNIVICPHCRGKHFDIYRLRTELHRPWYASFQGILGLGGLCLLLNIIIDLTL